MPSPPAVKVSPAKAATVNVRVPPEATLFFGSYQTKSKGSQRRYQTEPLRPGRTIDKELRAEVTIAGRKLVQTRQIQLKAGSVSNVKFDFSNVETTLKVNVPSDARVFLGSREKKGTGSVRVFRTKKLKLGKTVNGFPVRVSVVRNGKELSKEQRISLTCGETKTLDFRLDSNQSFAVLRK